MTKPKIDLMSAGPHKSRARKFFVECRDLAVSGFFFLMPLFVIFIVIAKVWTSLSSVGTSVAGMFGMKSVLGVKGSSVMTGLLLIIIWIVCGWLVRFPAVVALHKAAEEKVASYIPGYETYKTMAEEKIHKRTRILPYSSALIWHRECWQLAFLIEEDEHGNCVAFLPNTPDTQTGHVVLTRRDQLRIMPSITANQLDASLKKMGIGLLRELKVLTHDTVAITSNQP